MIRPVLLAAAAAAWGHAAVAGPLSLEGFFRGRLTAKGTIENFKDGTRRDFTIAMAAIWNGPNGTLIEDIAYVDGEREHKVWTFTKTGEGRYVGRRADLTRQAEVTEDADGIRMAYKANTRVPSGSTYNLAFDDRLTPISETVVAVRSDVSFLLIPAARVAMTITRQAER